MIRSAHVAALILFGAGFAGCVGDSENASADPAQKTALPSLAVQAALVGGGWREAYGHVNKSWHSEPTCGWGFSLENVTLPEVTRDGEHHGVFTDDPDIANRLYDVMADRNLSAHLTYSTAYTPGCGANACAMYALWMGECPPTGGWILLGIRSITNTSTNTTTIIEERAR